MRDVNFIKEAEQYITENNLGITVEELIQEFEHVAQVFEDFDLYLKESGLKLKYRNMLRSKRLKEKRKVFCKWYFDKYQSKPTKVLIAELSEITFMSERTVQEDTFNK